MVECLQSVKLGDVARVLEGVYTAKEGGVECLDVLVKYLYVVSFVCFTRWGLGWIALIVVCWVQV